MHPDHLCTIFAIVFWVGARLVAGYDQALRQSTYHGRLRLRPSAAHPNSSFLLADNVVDFNDGRKVSVDTILFGYDLLYERKELWRATTWLGIQIQQDPNDLLVIQELVWKLKPDLILDIGTNYGGSAIFFASLMNLYCNPGECRVVTIDPLPQTPKGPRDALNHSLWGKFVTFVKGKSTDTEVLETIGGLAESASVVVVNVDGDHTYDAVISDLKSYSNFVTVGSYMISQDTKLDRLWGTPAALKATVDFMAIDSRFVADREMEKLLYTQHANGFLRRVD
jgi:cephalosporin hydroxylase